MGLPSDYLVLSTSYLIYSPPPFICVSEYNGGPGDVHKFIAETYIYINVRCPPPESFLKVALKDILNLSALISDANVCRSDIPVPLCLLVAWRPLA